MAATVTSAWSKPGAWALDSEEHEDELKQQTISAAAEMSDFPDLMTAAATKTKKKKGQTLSLSEFVANSTNKSTNQTYQAAKGLTAEDMMMLPTGPRQRTAEELDRTRLGGGFRSYGDRNNESSNSRWSSGRSNGGDEEGRKSSREPLGPSRADEIDDWGAAKKSTVGGGFDRRERGGTGGFFEGSHSRADESDSWGSNKSYRPSEGRKGVGFDRERKMGFESSGDADTSDNWGRKKEAEGRRFGGGGGSAFDSLRERRVVNDSSDSDNWGKKREELNSGGSMSRPKLNLQPRKLPVGEVETVKPAAKGSNPFGDARPREEVLKQKGEDWKEIDEKLDSLKIKDLGSGDRFKRGIGGPRSNEDSTEKSWRKNQADVPPPRSKNNAGLSGGARTVHPVEGGNYKLVRGLHNLISRYNRHGWLSGSNLRQRARMWGGGRSCPGLQTYIEDVRFSNVYRRSFNRPTRYPIPVVPSTLIVTRTTTSHIASSHHSRFFTTVTAAASTPIGASDDPVASFVPSDKRVTPDAALASVAALATYAS